MVVPANSKVVPKNGISGIHLRSWPRSLLSSTHRERLRWGTFQAKRRRGPPLHSVHRAVERVPSLFPAAERISRPAGAAATA